MDLKQLSLSADLKQPESDSDKVSRLKVVKQVLKTKKNVTNYLPFGELMIDPAFITDNWKQMDYISGKISMINEFGLYFVGVKNVQEIEALRTHCDVYIFGLVPGPFTYLGELWGYEKVLKAIGRKGLTIAEGLSYAGEDIARQIAEFKKAGVQGIVVGDDICDQRGVIFGLKALQCYFVPVYQRLAQLIAALQLDSVFHACGKIDGLVAMIKDWGYAGLHGFDFTCYGLNFFSFLSSGLVSLGGLDVYHCSADWKKYYWELQQNHLQENGFLLCSTGGIISAYNAKKVFQVWRVLQLGGEHYAVN